jgi:elongation factor P
VRREVEFSMVNANDLRVGMTIELEGELWTLEGFQHVKRGRGGAFVRVTLKNFHGRQSIRKVFSPEQKIKDAFITERKAQYLYREKEDFHFMDLETFEDKIIPGTNLGEKTNFFKENMEVTMQLYEDEVIGIEIPIFVELRVKKAAPGVRGDTVGSASKSVILESGYDLSVPLFIKEGDIVRIDTRSKEYAGKA